MLSPYFPPPPSPPPAPATSPHLQLGDEEDKRRHSRDAQPSEHRPRKPTADSTFQRRASPPPLKSLQGLRMGTSPAPVAAVARHTQRHAGKRPCNACRALDSKTFHLIDPEGFRGKSKRTLVHEQLSSKAGSAGQLHWTRPSTRPMSSVSKAEWMCGEHVAKCMKKVRVGTHKCMEAVRDGAHAHAAATTPITMAGAMAAAAPLGAFSLSCPMLRACPVCSACSPPPPPRPPNPHAPAPPPSPFPRAPPPDIRFSTSHCFI